MAKQILDQGTFYKVIDNTTNQVKYGFLRKSTNHKLTFEDVYSNTFIVDRKNHTIQTTDETN
ncbi:MAG: hypothetical protein V4613_03620 [Bacteroidota bacterium]